MPITISYDVWTTFYFLNHQLLHLYQFLRAILVRLGGVTAYPAHPLAPPMLISFQ